MHVGLHNVESVELVATGTRQLIAFRLAAGIAILLGASGCALLSGRCTYESRAAHAEGRVTENGMEIARGAVDVGATRGSINARHLSYDISAAPLDGHFVSVALTDATRPGVILLDLPIIPQFQPATIRGVLDQRDDAASPALGGIFELVAANRAVLEVTTDLASRPLVRIPMTVTVHEDWSRPYCS